MKKLKKKQHKRVYRNNLDDCERERIRYNDRIRKQSKSKIRNNYNVQIVSVM